MTTEEAQEKREERETKMEGETPAPAHIEWERENTRKNNQDIEKDKHKDEERKGQKVI